MIMNNHKVQWNQHANPRMRVREGGDYWVIAEPATWDADSSQEYAARIYHGTFPIRATELGMAWGNCMDCALTNAIEMLERHLPAIEERLGQEARNTLAGAPVSHSYAPERARRRYAEEWRL